MSSRHWTRDIVYYSRLSELPTFFKVFVGYDSWRVSFDVNGGAVVLLERLLCQVVGHGVLDLGSGGNSRRESFDVSGGAWVLPEHRQFAVCEPRRHRPRLGLQSLDEDLRRARRR